MSTAVRAARRATLGAALLVALSGAGCATTSSTVGAGVCPEYRDLRCLTAPECSMDRQRGCRVCSCMPVQSAPGVYLPNPVPPDRRTPGP